MLDRKGCNSLATHNKVVGSKVVVVDSSVVVVMRVLVVIVSDFKELTSYLQSSGYFSTTCSSYTTCIYSIYCIGTYHQ